MTSMTPMIEIANPAAPMLYQMCGGKRVQMGDRMSIG
jgi:hypothetical protein